MVVLGFACFSQVFLGFPVTYVAPIHRVLQPGTASMTVRAACARVGLRRTFASHFLRAGAGLAGQPVRQLPMGFT